MENKIMRKISKFIPVAGILIFIYIMIDIGIDNISNAFSLISVYIFAFALLLFFPRIILFTYKWQYICRKQKMDFKFLYLFKVIMKCTFYGSVTPGALGWHMRIYYLKKKTKDSLEKCITNSLLDTTVGFIAGLFLALIGSIVLIGKVPILLPVISLFLILYLSAFVIFMKKDIGNKISNFVVKIILPKKYKQSAGQSIELLYEDIPKIRDLFTPFVIECITWIMAATQVYIIAMAFSINIPYHVFILISIISVVATGILPISIGGLGVREGTFVFLLSMYGIAPSIAFVISLGGYLVKMLIPGMIGVFFSFGAEK